MSKSWNNLLWLFAIVVFHFNGIAQINRANVISTSEGLPSPKVRALCIDLNSNIWIGTENGLATYKNGIVTPQLINDSIPFYNCWSIVQDSEGGMWFAGYGEGVAYKSIGKWKTFTIQNGLISNNTRKLFYHNGKMYIGCDKGVMSIDIDSNNISVYMDSSWRNIYPHVLGFYVNMDTVYAVTNNQGVYRLIESNTGVEKVNDITPIHGVHVFKDSIILSHEKSNYYGLISDVNSGKPVEQSEANSSFWAFDTTDSGNLFAAGLGLQNGTGGVYNMASNKWSSNHLDWGIRTNDFRSLVIDKNANTLYAGSMTKGLFVVDLNQIIIDYPGESVKQALAAPDGVWVLHNSYLEFIRNNNTTINFNPGQFKNFAKKNESRLAFDWALNSHGYKLGKNKNQANISIYQIRLGNVGVWVNTSIGMFELNSDGSFNSFLPTHNFIFNVTDSNTIIEAIPYGGIRFLEAQEEEKYFDLSEPNVPDNVLDIVCYDSTIFFTSIFSGLYCYNNNQFVSYKKVSLLADEKLRKLYKADSNELWVVTDFGRLYKVNVNNGFHILDTIDVSELYGAIILDVSKYNEYTLILTNEGLNIYHSNKGNRLIDAEQGLTGDLYGIAVKNNCVYVGAFSGYYKVNLTKLLNQPINSKKLTLARLLVNNKEVEINDAKNSSLNYDENAIQVFFETDGFQYPNKVEYQYRLRDDQLWSSPTTNTFILLPYLQEGNYQIEIRVQDANEGTLTDFSLLSIQISGAFYKAWWFYILIVLGLFGVGYGYSKRRTSRLLKEEQLIASANFELDKSKMQGLLSRMNPHFLFNALNSIQSFVLNNETDRAVRYIGKFARLMRSTLDLSQSLMITLDEEVNYLKSYIEIENLRFENKVECIWEIDGKIDLADIEIPGMVLQPIIENVFVHGFTPEIKDPKLEIKVSIDNVDYIKVVIKDNGVGCDLKNVNSNSKGINLIRKRLILLEKDMPHLLQMNSELGKETVVEVLFFVGGV
jgi:ligand-binding sensor domain-containing protein